MKKYDYASRERLLHGRILRLRAVCGYDMCYNESNMKGGGDMGLFDGHHPFDFNRDGKRDMRERFLEYMIYEECTKPDPAPDYEGYGWGSDSSWQDDCEGGEEYGLDPYDFDDPDEYEEALEEAKAQHEQNLEALRELERSGQELENMLRELESQKRAQEAVNEMLFSLPPDPKEEAIGRIKRGEYPNQRSYDAACELARIKGGWSFYSDGQEKREAIARCRLILKGKIGDNEVFAAKYLTAAGHFLLGQAVKDHFDLPIDLPAEDAESVVGIRDIILHIAEKDIPLSLEVWRWCFQEFSPYRRYCTQYDFLLGEILWQLEDFPDGFSEAFFLALEEDPAFCKRLFRDNLTAVTLGPDLLSKAVLDCKTELARNMTASMLKNPEFDESGRKHLADITIHYVSGCQNMEALELLLDPILPMVRETLTDSVNLKRLDKEAEKIREEIENLYLYSERYRFSGRNAWRKNYSAEMGADPANYPTEEAYLEELKQQKIRWRARYQHTKDWYGLDPETFETEQELQAAVAAYRESKRQANIEREQREKAEREKLQLPVDDNNIYTYCQVRFPGTSRAYHYRTSDQTLDIGDTVVVPVGAENRETEAVIVSVGRYLGSAAPYPPGRTKEILRKL